MYIILLISIFIVMAVLILAVLTTNKAYAFKHTVDPIRSEKEDEKGD